MSNQFLKLRRSAIPGKIPTTSSLELGEIALNTYDGLAFMKKSGSSGEEIVTLGTGTGGGNMTGSQYFVPVFNTTSSLVTSSIFDSGSFTAIGAIAPVDPTNPDRLFIDAGNTTSYNLLSGHGEIDDYLQLNIQNFSFGATASSDIVATANNGTENDYYIDVGINGSGYADPNGIGAANDAYLYSTGQDLLIGNLTEGHRVIIFNGAGGAIDNARVYITSEGTVGINASNPNPTNPEALLVEPLSGSLSSDFNNLIVGKGTINENYMQLNIQNLGSGSIASSDIVATNDSGSETGYYIDMGINSSNYNTPNSVGMANDAYLYSTGEHLHIGNASANMPVMFFAGGLDSEANKKLELWPDNQHIMSGSLNITGSLNVLEGITGSLQGTASWAENAITSSYALTASIALNVPATASYALDALSASFASTASIATSASFASTASSADNFLVRGTLTAQTIVTQVITSSTDFVTGSTRFGSIVTNTHQFTGSVSITGSLNSPNITGSLLGTASWANNATTASYVLNAVSASFASTASSVNQLNQNVVVSGSLTVSGSTNFVGSTGTTLFSSNADTLTFTGSIFTSGSIVSTGSLNISSITSSLLGTASYATQALSASFATTASYVLNAVSSSFASTASFVQNAQSASYVLNAVSSSFASTASFAPSYLLTSATSSMLAPYVLNSQTSSFVLNSQTSSMSVATASFATSSISASFASTASLALNAISASYFSGSISSAVTAETASYITSSGVYGPFGSNSILSSSYAITASVAINAVSASYFSGSISSAVTAETASYITSSGVFGPYGANSILSASYAVTAAFALNAGGGGAAFPFTGSAIITGSLTVTGSTTSTLGFTGSLFGTSSWATNALTASYVLNAVSASFATTASYINSLRQDVTITGSLLLSSSLYSSLGSTGSAATTTTLVSVSTGSYTAGFFDYTVTSGSNARAGTIMSVWNDGSVQYTDNSTLDIGNTSDITMSVALSSGNVLLRSTTTAFAWTIKTTYRLI